jgi:hypothetical protein
LNAVPIDADRRVPEEWLFLRRLHPREGWQAEPRLGELGRFWLARHALFRNLAQEVGGRVAALCVADDAWTGGRALAPRLQLFLGELDGHHRIEDVHYFPAFRRAEPRLAKGFALLDADHHALEVAIGDVVASAQALLTSLAPERPAPEAELARHARALERLQAGLIRHFDDEEDLVVPLLIVHGGG